MHCSAPECEGEDGVWRTAKPLKWWSETVDAERVAPQLPTAHDRGGREPPDLGLVGPC
jgi:hypothetical protein